MKVLWTLLVTITLCACGTKSVHAEKKQGPAATETHWTATSPITQGPTPTSAVSADAVPEKPTKATSPAASAPLAAPAHHSERGPIPADQALGWLQNGNRRFVHAKLRNDGQSAKDRERLTAGQKPHTIVLSCSDSRVPPEVLFDQKLGEIFVIRTAGETLDFGAIGSIEYALQHLGTNLILVMGHESCGAVKAALSTLGGGDAGSPALNKLVQDLHPHLRSFASTPVSEGALVEGWANATGVAKDLVERSEIVRDAVNSGEVKIQTALYHLGSGVVEFR